MPTPLIQGPALAKALLNPDSVALLGISDDDKASESRPLKFLRAAGFKGRIYPIHPDLANLQGLTAYPDLASLPEVPEHVLVLSPTASVLAIARQCGELGVKVVTVRVSGFSESGPEGIAREQALRDISQRTGVRIVGPGSLGVIVPRNGLVLTANATFSEPLVENGRIFVASHSGSMIGALVSHGKERGIGYAGLVAVCNEADLSIGEICALTLDDPNVDAYLLFLESLRHGEQLRSFALAAAQRGKPVIAYKLGRSAAAAEMALTHTGALAGEDDVADAFLKDLGIARVATMESLLESIPLARRLPLNGAGPRRVGIVTTTGGGAAMVVDQLAIRGVIVEPPSAHTLALLNAAGIPAHAGRALDLTLAGTKYEVMKKALDIALAAPEFDMVLAVIGSSARFQAKKTVRPIIECAAAGKPIAAMLVPDASEAMAYLAQAGVPCFRTPESCGDTIAALFARRSPGTQALVHHNPHGKRIGMSEAQAYGVLDRIGIAHAPFVTTALSGAAPALAFDYPVVAKVCSAHIQHKTEIGGVVLDIKNRTELDLALASLRAALTQQPPAGPCEEVLIQPMCAGLIEVLIGYRIDREAGPIVLLAAGGIWAEVTRDRSIRLAPITVDTAMEMIGEVKALSSVTGKRGKPRGDLDALARALSALSQLALQPDLHIVEAEVNPLLVLREGQGVLAVDALVIGEQ